MTIEQTPPAASQPRATYRTLSPYRAGPRPHLEKNRRQDDQQDDGNDENLHPAERRRGVHLDASEHSRGVVRWGQGH